VESNKPIAITIKDDSVVKNGCRDLLGDQIVPVEVVGTEYVVQKGFLDGEEHLFITAVEDGTTLSFNGQASSATLDKGEVFRHVISGSSTYLVSSKPVYVFHATGFGCELGMALLPSITCKGSQQIGFSRTTTEFFGLNVLVRKEGIDHFTINGSQTLIPASRFSAVPGTNDRYYTAQLSFTTSQINVGQGSLITNDKNSFQVGIINGDAMTSCRYGYFSSFSTLFIGDDFSICEGETAFLDAGANKESYLWSTGETTQQATVSDPGMYWVKVVKEECELVDSILVDVKTGKVELGPDVTLCLGDTTKIDGKENFSWTWSDSTTQQYLEISEPGKYWVDVVDYNGCQASDTIHVIGQQPPPVDLGTDITKCSNDSVTLDATYPGATYLWSNGSQTPTNKIISDGEHWVKVTHNGCDATDSINVVNLQSPQQDTIYGSPSVCPFSENIAYHADNFEDSQYHWEITGGTIVVEQGSAIEVNWNSSRDDAAVSLVVSNSLGCKSDSLNFKVRVNKELIVEIPEGPDSLCLNSASGVVYQTPLTNGSFYEWEISGGEILEGQGTETITVNWSKGENTLLIRESATTSDIVCTGISSALHITVFEDTLGLAIKYVSIDTANEDNVIIKWTSLGRPMTELTEVYRKAEGDEAWFNIRSASSADTLVISGEVATSTTSYEYVVSTMNTCQEEVSSGIHNTMVLTGVGDEVLDEITLSWNHYMGWPGGVARYEIWRKLDEAPGLELLAEVPGDQTSFRSKIGSDGFKHRFVVRAIEQNGTHTSWSNSSELKFEHPIEVPNIFTPNEDDKNQYFTIPKIEIYKNSVLTIVDRWGKTVFQTRGYGNNWDAENLSTGLYFYTLTLNRDGKFYKGIVTIVR
jgi:gliding motility-associated-like protein